MLQYEILVDRTERPQKCTILPLEGRADFNIRRFARGRPIAPLTSDLLLHMDGVSLAELGQVKSAASVRSLALIDSTWRWLPTIFAQIEAPLPTLVRIPPGFVTAYPRRNKEDRDPAAGLATIEALFIAAAFCGVWDPTLLAKYHFGQAFLDANRDIFAHFGLGPDESQTTLSSVAPIA